MPISEPDYCSTQIPLTGELRSRVLELANSIPDSELAVKGRETDPHITLLFGLTECDPGAVKKLLSRVQRSIRFTLGKVSVFAREGKGYEVVKVDVDSPDLHELNALLKTLPHVDIYPEYQPHATLAFVKKGKGQKWVEKFGSLSLSGQSTSVVFSDKNRTHTPITVGIGAEVAETPLKFAKLPESESGTLTPEQEQILKSAVEKGELTGVGALGDHLAENGFPNSAAVLTHVANRHPTSYWQEFRGQTLTHPGVPPGTFKFQVLRDGADLLHHFRVSPSEGRGYTFGVRLSPEQQKMARTSRPLKYEAARPVHPLVSGYRLQHVLQHLKTSPDTTDAVKHLSAAVLHDGDTTALRPLYDALQDQGHPLSHAYNWPNAEWKLHLDAAVGTALDAVAARHLSTGYDPRTARSFAHQYLQFANQGVRRDFIPGQGRVDPGAAGVAQEGMEILHGIGHSKEDIAESLNRHLLRNSDAVRPDLADIHHGAALRPVPIDHPLDKASRYARTKVRTPVHELVKGTRLAIALKSLAKTGNDTTKSLSKAVLRDGDTNALAVLADHLDTPPDEGGNSDHELARAGYDFRGAAKRLHLDRVIHPLVTARTLEHWPEDAGTPQVHNGTSVTARLMLRGLTIYDDALAGIRKAAAEVDPDVTPKDIEGSLHRLATHSEHRFNIEASSFPTSRADAVAEARSAALSPSKAEGMYGDHTPESNRLDNDAARFRFSRLKEKLRFARTPNPRRGDFLTALRRIQSLQQDSLRKLVEGLFDKGGLSPVTVRDAIHSSGRVASASTAAAVYHQSDPDLVRKVAAEYGLATQSPALLLLHVSEDGKGTDAIHKVSVRGSGESLLRQLDKAGFAQRTLIPTKTGWEVFLPDFGMKSTDKIKAFAQRMGSGLQSSVGSAEIIGKSSDSTADSDTRSEYRNISNPQPSGRS